MDLWDDTAYGVIIFKCFSTGERVDDSIALSRLLGVMFSLLSLDDMRLVLRKSDIVDNRMARRCRGGQRVATGLLFLWKNQLLTNCFFIPALLSFTSVSSRDKKAKDVEHKGYNRSIMYYIRIVHLISLYIWSDVDLMWNDLFFGFAIGWCILCTRCSGRCTVTTLLLSSKSFYFGFLFNPNLTSPSMKFFWRLATKVERMEPLARRRGESKEREVRRIIRILSLEITCKNNTGLPFTVTANSKQVSRQATSPTSLPHSLHPIIAT